MNSTLPPDPYKLLGVTKEAKLPEIRSAHRKLVLKCHPDKVQDAALKAIKQDEFQKVQQAYELLSDDSKRLQYDEQVKLFELRKEMGRGNPTPRSNPFEYEVKTAEPRANSYGRPKVYSYPTSSPRSNEEAFEERHMPRKSASNESASERKRSAVKEEEIRFREATSRKVEEEREKQRQRERERERESTKRSHREKKKSSDKDRRRGTEEKVRSRATYIEEDSSDDEVRRTTASRVEATRAAERKLKHRMEEEIRIREEAARASEAAARLAQEQQRPKEAPMSDKWNEHRDFAGAYMQAARRKVAVETDIPRHPGMHRAETFSPASSPSYGRYTAAQPQYSDDDMPKRSSAGRKESSRRSSETPAVRTEKPSRRRSPPAPTSDPYIVEPPSPTAAPRKPTLQTYTSAPPVFARELPSRSKTQDYPRKEAAMPPPLPRASTFQSGDRPKASGSSKLRNHYTSESEPDSPVYNSPRPHSPPPTRRSEPTRYIVENGRTVPVVATSRTHRSEMREEYPQVRSESPRGTPSRPPITRNPPSNERPRTTRSQSTTYYQAEPEPVVLTARPKLNREGSGQRGSSRGPTGGAYFDNVQYGTKYNDADVIYSAHAQGIQDYARRGSERRDREYSNYQRGTLYV
ncbi:hypothetical protein BKA65DRAFT_181990 [Rhexocercosporidium sp. MPI-PUGE-AT-0058]|nr:hypothetical protein BKA65DRAFT_181990 [Rhexocercosporidium sp. MPI-PUGE-AT-0058]